MPRTKKKKIKLRNKRKVAVKPSINPAATNDLKLKRTRVKVIGLGDGASQIVLELAKELKGVEFYAANTDWQKSQRFPREVKVVNFGEKYTRGLGTGTDPEIGKLAALAEKEKIKQILKGGDLCFLIACLGGGTGSGAGPVFVKACQQQGILSFGIFTLPFKFEGEKKMAVAREGLEKMKVDLNAALVLPNEKIFQALDKNLSLKESFLRVNQVLGKSLEGLIGLVFRPGLINIDFADLTTILSGRGKSAYLTSAEFERGAKNEEIRKKIFQNIFLSHNFRQSRQVLFNIIADSQLSLNEVSDISQQVFQAVHPNSKIIFGVSFDKKMAGKIRVILLAISSQEKNSRSKKAPSDKSKRKGKKESDKSESGEVKIRRNAIQVREGIKAEQESLAAKEQIWETPAILRKGLIQRWG